MDDLEIVAKFLGVTKLVSDEHRDFGNVQFQCSLDKLNRRFVGRIADDGARATDRLIVQEISLFPAETSGSDVGADRLQAARLAWPHDVAAAARRIQDRLRPISLLVQQAIQALLVLYVEVELVPHIS